MTRARYTHVSLDSTPYYHCICRCVRRAFLCGVDSYSGQDYEHRRRWVVEHLARLVSIFSIELCAYAVMSNHYHLVVRIDRPQALAWSDEEVAERWMRLFNGPEIVRRWLAGETDVGETLRAREVIAVWRSRLFDLGWFMKCLNEYLARRANQEDGCKGRFWESRYKCQALLDEKALLSCMAYVDLNPVRAGMADTPEGSDYTSVKQRADALKGTQKSGNLPELLSLDEATPSADASHTTIGGVRLTDYLRLVDSTGRALRPEKRGAISNCAADILDRLGIQQQTWLRSMRPGRYRRPLALGSMPRLLNYARSTGRKWIVGWRAACVLG